MGELIRLLYVDDEKEWLDSIKQLLEKNDFEVDTALDGEEGRERLADKHYDMILLDVRLKGKNGWELVSEFRALREGVAIVLYTSEYNIEKLADVYGIGAEDYLEKSLDIVPMVNRLKALNMKFRKDREQSRVFEIAPNITFVSGCGILNVGENKYILKSNEEKFLHILCVHRPSVVSMSRLCEKIWGSATLLDYKEKSLRNLASSLRKYFENTPVRVKRKRFDGYFLSM